MLGESLHKAGCAGKLGPVLLWPSSGVKARGFCKINKGSMEGHISNRLEMPTSKGNQSDLVSQPS